MSLNTRNLPDAEICQIRAIGINKFDQCLVANPIDCFYALPFGNAHFCRFPERNDLFQQGKVNTIRNFIVASEKPGE